ncbi:MAG: ABC transporter ATP-binding protein [Coprobacillaceae bacterium]
MRLWKYIKEYKVSATIGFVFKVLEAVLELAVPIVMADIIDKGIKNQDTNYIYHRGILLVLLGVGGYLFALVCQYYASKASQGVGTALRTDLYKKINTYDYRNLDSLSAPTLVTRISNDVIQIQLAVAMTIRLTSRAPFLIIGSLIMSFIISSKLSFIFVIGGVVLAIVMLGITIISVPYFRIIQKKLDTISRITRENLQGIRVIRAFSKQKKEKKRFYKETKDQQDTQVKVGKIQALSNPLTYVIVNIAIIIIVYQGGLQVQIGDLTQGEIIALVNYMNQILLALIVFTNVLTIYNKASASYTRVMEVLDEEPSIIETDSNFTWDDNQPRLQFEDVNFAYQGNNVLKDVSFTLQPGETLGIIGGTGAGKSTVVNLIGRFYDVQSGNIYIGGNSILDISTTQLRRDIGIVPQQAALLSGTLRENLILGNVEATDEEIYQALEIAQAKDFIDSLPDGLDTMIVQGGKNVSGGQRQRITIARALLKKPKILILDNSDSALDNMTSVALRRALQTVSDVSTIIISQRTFALEHADQILVLYHGDVVGYNTHQELLKSCEVHQEIYNSQQIKEDK